MSKHQHTDRRAVLAAAAVSALLPAGAAASIPNTLPVGAVIRVSRGRFDPAQFAQVDAMIRRTGEYLVPAIRKLPGLIAYYAGTSPEGVTTQVSIWASSEQGLQMGTLPEMRDRARAEAIEMGEMMGVPVAKPAEPVTPAQARKLGLSDEIVAEYAHRPSGGLRVVADEGGTSLARVFGSARDAE